MKYTKTPSGYPEGVLAYFLFFKGQKGPMAFAIGPF